MENAPYKVFYRTDVYYFDTASEAIKFCKLECNKFFDLENFDVEFFLQAYSDNLERYVTIRKFYSACKYLS